MKKNKNIEITKIEVDDILYELDAIILEAEGASKGGKFDPQWISQIAYGVKNKLLGKI